MNPSSRSAILTFTVMLVLAALAPAQTFTTLYDFTGGSDGGHPVGAVIQDPAGNLYGTASVGGDLSCFNPDGPYGCGVVYEVNAAGKETILYGFKGWLDGAYPNAPVIRDKAGNIYGTTYGGGASDQGTVFKINSGGTETVLYSFTGRWDGSQPDQGLVRDSAGNLYGTTPYGGSPGFGTIFRIDSAGAFTLLHSFKGYPSDGANPQFGHLTMDKAGNLYGVTSLGGAALNSGVLYKLSKNGTYKVLHNFGLPGTGDGCSPYGSVAQDTYGNFYGTTSSCGTKGYGTIWKVSTTGKETVLYNFARRTSHECRPLAGVTPDSKGNLYGVLSCGSYGNGALYELSASGRLTLLHSFDYSDGANPDCEVWRTGNGTLFGTTYSGGNSKCYGSNCGTVWSYVP